MSEPDDIFDGDPYDAALIKATEDKQYEHAKEYDEPTRAYLAQRARAYKAVFRPGKRDQADIDFVLRDLASFCRAAETRYHPEQKKQDMLEGRAEVFYRILAHTTIDTDTLYQMVVNPNRR